jgi:hypothetical protein
MLESVAQLHCMENFYIQVGKFHCVCRNTSENSSLESIEKFYWAYWNVLEIFAIHVEKHTLENSNRFIVWSCDIYHLHMLEFCISPCNSVHEGVLLTADPVLKSSAPLST